MTNPLFWQCACPVFNHHSTSYKACRKCGTTIPEGSLSSRASPTVGKDDGIESIPSDQLKDCSCKEPWTKRVIHRNDAPCYWPERKDTNVEDSNDVEEEANQKEDIETSLKNWSLLCEDAKAAMEHGQAPTLKLKIQLEILSYIRTLQADKDMLLKTVKATAEGALVHSEENKKLREVTTEIARNGSYHGASFMCQQVLASLPKRP